MSETFPKAELPMTPEKKSDSAPVLSHEAWSEVPAGLLVPEDWYKALPEDPEWRREKTLRVAHVSGVTRGPVLHGVSEIRAQLANVRNPDGSLAEDFKKWLQSSIAQDENGEPITLYHFSYQDVPARPDLSKSRELGLHVSFPSVVQNFGDTLSDPQTPQASWKSPQNAAGVVTPIVTNVKSPLRIEDVIDFKPGPTRYSNPKLRSAIVRAILRDKYLQGHREWAKRYHSGSLRLQWRISRAKTTADFQKILKDYGYDSILYKAERDSGVPIPAPSGQPGSAPALLGYGRGSIWHEEERDAPDEHVISSIPDALIIFDAGNMRLAYTGDPL
jgi:hypothetical protein